MQHFLNFISQGNLGLGDFYQYLLGLALHRTEFSKTPPRVSHVARFCFAGHTLLDPPAPPARSCLQSLAYAVLPPNALYLPSPCAHSVRLKSHPLHQVFHRPPGGLNRLLLSSPQMGCS